MEFGYEGWTVKRDLLNMKTPEQERQIEMARQIGHLKSKAAKRQQAHMLCLSLVKMIRGK